MRGVFGVSLSAILGVSTLWADQAPAQKPSPINKFRERGFMSYMKELLEYDEPHKFQAQGVPFSVTHTNAHSSKNHILIGCVIQKGELGCLPLIVDLFRDFKEGKIGAYQGRITFFVANPHAAARLNANFPTWENMSFSSRSKQGLEKERADDLKKLFNGVEVFLEITQKYDPTGMSYYSFEYDDLTAEWANYLRAADTLITPPEYNNATHSTLGLENSMSMSEYSRQNGILTLSMTLAHKEKTEAALEASYKLARTAVERTLSLRSRISLLQDIYDIVKKEKAFAKLAEVKQGAASVVLKNFYQTTYLESFVVPELSLLPEIANFNELKKGEVIGKSGAVDLLAPRDGFILNPQFPKRDEKGAALEPLPPYLFQMIEKVDLEKIKN